MIDQNKTIGHGIVIDASPSTVWSVFEDFPAGTSSGPSAGGRLPQRVAAGDNAKMSSETPLSPKVVASAAGAGLGTAISTLIVWLLGVLVWKQPWTAAAVNEAMAAVPTTVSGLVFLLVTAASAAGPGYRVTDPSRAANAAELDALEAARLKPPARHNGATKGKSR